MGCTYRVSGVDQRLVAGEDHEMPCFLHVSEMLHSLVDSQQLYVVGAILLLRRAHLLGKECYGSQAS